MKSGIFLLNASVKTNYVHIHNVLSRRRLAGIHTTTKRIGICTKSKIEVLSNKHRSNSYKVRNKYYVLCTHTDSILKIYAKVICGTKAGFRGVEFNNSTTTVTHFN